MSEYLDTSVVVKWFKRTESHHRESKVLLDRIIDQDGAFVMSKYGVLELIRALMKANQSLTMIEDSYHTMIDLYRNEAIRSVPMEPLIHLTKNIQLDLNLYASDALHLASAIQSNCQVFWTEDHHHHNQRTMDYVKKYDMTIVRLDTLE